MQGYRFTDFVPPDTENESTFDSLWNIFRELLLITSGDPNEALSWLTNLDKQYGISTEGYGIGDFIEDLKKQGLLRDDPADGKLKITAKTESTFRKSALEEIFGKLRKSGHGSHKTFVTGQGDEKSVDMRDFQFGDSPDNIAMTDSIRNAQINNGLGEFSLTERDLEVVDNEYKTQTSTVLMIDISHSMILYGEDRITPAKKVAMALSELILKKYKKDTLDVIVFGNDAWQIEIKDLPYLSVGPYHTNTVAGLELAMDILRKRKNQNKQIFMITDGKPTCMKVGIKYYKNSFGLDPKILKKTMNLAASCRKLNIPITTFMIASDPYLKQFVKDFTAANNGNAYYSDLQGLGNIVFEDFKKNRRKNYRW
ncbi:VWA domain-containing protein [Reichenbachiella agarivorans]|uniref:VWA domain-containing protein n=1 Tax=Reichenbachiella agarivorans TaxID=2979464 RepID=A0ABY6CPE2_9BACT|nr:VWA domain-containing protein [Reichenbachiella agarivorans]UXP32387.1 VWA domain-containing protein [Reichenbachiella agarivorans]